MKYSIQKCADMISINKNTIRYYRDIGLINPKLNPGNGYYEYNDNDLILLLQIIKQRKMGLSLDQIEHSFSMEISYPNLLINIESSIDELTKEIHILEAKLTSLKNRRQYIYDCFTMLNVVEKKYFGDTKYDILLDVDTIELNNAKKECLLHAESIVPVIHISQEYLNHPIGDPAIRIGLGIYESTLISHHMKLPKQAYILPKGIYLTMVLCCHGIEEITQQTLKPYLEYAQKNNIEFLSDTTALLIHIFKKNGKPLYYFRIRALIQMIE